MITKSFKKCSISNDLDDMEDEILWAEQYGKSNTDSDEEGDNMYDDKMYDDTRTDTTDVQWRVMMMNFLVLNNFADLSVSYTQVRLQGGLLVLKPGASYTWVWLIWKYIYSTQILYW